MKEPVMADLPRVLFRGDDFSVLVKPAGMSSELTLDDPSAVDPSLLAWARCQLDMPDARLPHRLDRITRGLIVIAHDAESAARLGNDLAAGRWRKHYLARVHPSPSKAADGAQPLVGMHTLHLNRTGRRAEIVRSGGQRAVTEILATAPAPDHPGESHVLLRLHTGRFHQIRATLAHLGAPVTDDPLYDERARGGSRPYLEHILLRMPVGDELRVFHDQHDPSRERVADELPADLRLSTPKG